MTDTTITKHDDGYLELGKRLKSLGNKTQSKSIIRYLRSCVASKQFYKGALALY